MSDTRFDIGCMVELTVSTLDGKRWIVRGLLDRPITFGSAVALVSRDEPTRKRKPRARARRALTRKRKGARK